MGPAGAQHNTPPVLRSIDLFTEWVGGSPTWLAVAVLRALNAWGQGTAALSTTGTHALHHTGSRLLVATQLRTAPIASVQPRLYNDHQ